MELTIILALVMAAPGGFFAFVAIDMFRSALFDEVYFAWRCLGAASAGVMGFLSAASFYKAWLIWW